MSKYKPESVISTLASVMEKLIDNRNYEYLMNSNLLTNSQHGFRRNHSTVTALLHVTNRWYRNTDIGQLNGVPFRDLRKHSTLLIMILFLESKTFMESEDQPYPGSIHI